MIRRVVLAWLAAFALGLASAACADELQPSPPIAAALERAGANRGEIENALSRCPSTQRQAMAFLVENMPDRDLRELTAEFLLDNCRLAAEARDAAPWGKSLPEEIYLNEVLPYGVISERREPWRHDLRARFLPAVQGATRPAQAAAILNQKVFAELGVRYSTDRPKADQSPLESIEAKKATCTGLSVLLIAACRAVGVPARFAGTPLWADQSGNHSWVEVWDDGWHFTGAAEPTGAELDRAWFLGRASQAQLGHPIYAIFASSWRKTPLSFPLVWARSVDWVPAVDVTARYTALKKELAPGQALLSIRALEHARGRRVAASVLLREESSGREIYRGPSRDERFDLNDHLVVEVPQGVPLALEVCDPLRVVRRSVVVASRERLETVVLDEGASLAPARAQLEAPEESFLASADGRWLAESLDAYFGAEVVRRREVPLSADLDRLVLEHPRAARELAQKSYRRSRDREQEQLRQDFEANRVHSGDFTSPYTLRAVGRMPPRGWPLFIALHGGGGVPKEVNDSQWRHMQIYYRDQGQLEGYLYLALRAPNDTWNGFYDSYTLRLFEVLLRQLILCASVDSNRVFVLGYSHGGYGAFHIGLNLADRFAAVHASAAAPTEGNRPGLSLRNTPFTFMIGEKDTMYERLDRCLSFDQFVQGLRDERSGAYPVEMQLQKGFGHGGLPDRDKIQEMYPHVRNPVPRNIVWALGRTVERFHWLHAPEPSGGSVEASVADNRVEIVADGVKRLQVYLDERLIDPRRPVQLEVNGERTEAWAHPSLRVLCETLEERGDPELAFTARLDVHVPEGAFRRF